MTDHKALIARLREAMEGYDSEALGDDPHEFDSWQLLYDAKAALEALIAERAVVEAQALERFADHMDETYPEDIFPQPSREQYSMVSDGMSIAGFSLDRFSADLMRRAGELARARAVEIREGRA